MPEFSIFNFFQNQLQIFQMTWITAIQYFPFSRQLAQSQFDWNGFLRANTGTVASTENTTFVCFFSNCRQPVFCAAIQLYIHSLLYSLTVFRVSHRITSQTSIHESSPLRKKGNTWNTNANITSIHTTITTAAAATTTTNNKTIFMHACVETDQINEGEGQSSHKGPVKYWLVLHEICKSSQQHQTHHIRGG